MAGQGENKALRELARKALDQLGDIDGMVRGRALQVAAEQAVSLVYKSLPGLPSPSIVYHVDRDRLPDPHLADGCRLFTDAMPQSNGVILKGDQAGLRCSHPTCGRTICPFALAACYALLSPDEAGTQEAAPQATPATESAPTSETTSPGVPKPHTAYSSSVFRNTWLPRTEGSLQALNLLASTHENDFAGVLVADDDSYVDEFIKDVAALLQGLGKTQQDPRRIHAMQLVSLVDPTSGLFRDTGRPDMAPGRLHVIDRLGDLKNADGSPSLEAQRGFLLERLGHIVDGRYVLLVGNEKDISDLLGANRVLSMTYGAHVIRLNGMSAQDIFRSYEEMLDPSPQSQLDEAFHTEFVSYVEFNRDILPFKGRELADYLAKQSNAEGRLVLPKSRFQSSSLEGMLDGIVGLGQIKATIRQLAEEARFRKRMENAGHHLPRANMHMLFMGNPGTGKTMVARLVASMLYKIGICRLNNFVEVSSKDLIGKYVGHTDKQTHEVIRQALGGVLFIDEAYALAMDSERGGSEFGKEALAELVKSMEDYKDDLIVILAGYEKEMQELVDVNPGLSSRIGYTFHFEDYSTKELLDIFRLKTSRTGLALAPGVDDALAELFDYFRRFRSFGNGRFVDKVVQKTITNHAHRHAAGEGAEDALMTIAPEEVPTRQEMFDVLDWKQQSAREMLEPLVGLKAVKEQVETIERVTAFRERARRAHLTLPDQNLNMVFTGNPGTGKTTVARIVAKVLYGVGAVPNDRFVEVQAKDLVSSMAGNTGETVSKVVESALGGVLFLDEAYALSQSSVGDEAIAALVKEMSDHRGELVVIFAGYTQEMRQFLDLNPGMASRIGYRLEFEDYKPEELNEIFGRSMRKAGFELGDGVLDESLKVMKFFHSVEDFGNGRFVDRVVQETIAKHSGHYTEETLKTIVPEDVPTAQELARVSATTTYEVTDMSDERDVLRVAKHEVGHAICRLVQSGTTDIVLITIEQEGNGALGYVEHKVGGKALPTSEDLRAEIACLMGGMAAEDLAFGAYSAGNSSDLEQATVLAARYVATYGMSEAGMVQYLPPRVGRGSLPKLLPSLPQPVLDQMNDLLRKGFEQAKEYITKYQDRYDRMVDVLVRERSLTGERLMDVWNGADQAREG